MTEARISARIDNVIKEKAVKQLKAHGLSLSEFVRVTVTTVANNGLPKDWGLPNKKVLASLDEVVDDLNDDHLVKTKNKKELEKLLNE